MWFRIIIPVGFLLLAALVWLLRARNQHRRCYTKAIKVWGENPPAKRRDALVSTLTQTGINAPAWFLIGCSHLVKYETREAARAFGMAHHGDCNIQTAALLTFACLKTGDGADSPLIENIIDTWHELKRFDIWATKVDRLLLDGLGDDTPTEPPLSPLGTLIWRTTGPSHRAKLQVLLNQDNPKWAALRP